MGAPAILHTIRSVDPSLGGPVEVVKQLAGIHREMGCAVEVVSLDGPDDAWVKAAPFPVQALGERDAGSGGYGYSAKFVPWLKENGGKYDAVISHGLWQYNNAGTRQALRGTDTPYYVFPHGMLDPWFKRAYPVKHLKKWIYWILRERHVLRDARAVLFTCEEERVLAQNTFLPYRCDERVIPLGIAAPRLEEGDRQRRIYFEKFPSLAGKRILLFLGRLHDKKGCDMLVPAFGKMAAESEEAFHLVMAGPCADEAYERELRRLAAEHCPPESVSFPGMLSGDLKWGAFHAAEAFILPSHQENFGIAVVEALGCAVPVLISNKVNIWREIAGDDAGIVQADDVAGTQALLEKWGHLDGAGRALMSAAALACFKKRFQIESTARELLELIASSATKAVSPDAPASNH
ncbi:MAG: glycosyltransferase [Chthoniobacteraceae bacterium]